MGINHLEDRRQKTSGYPYPLPPPLGVVFLPHVTYMVGGGIFDSYMVCWYYMLVVATYALDMIVVGGIYFF